MLDATVEERLPEQGQWLPQIDFRAHYRKYFEFVRTIRWGASELCSALSKKFSLPLVDAMKLLETRGAVLLNNAGQSQDQIQISEALTEAIASFIRDLRLILLECTGKLDLKDIFLTGGLANLNNINPYLTMQLGIPVNHFSYINELGIQNTFDSAHENQFAGAIGLALEAVPRPLRPTINFLKGELAKENKALKLVYEAWRPALMTSVAVFVALMVWAFSREMLIDDGLEMSTTRITEVAKALKIPGGSSPSAVTRHINRTKNQIKLVESLEKVTSYKSAAIVLADLAGQLPTGSFDTSKIQILEKMVQIDVVPKKINRAQFEAALNRVAAAKSVRSLSTRNDLWSYQFSVVR